MIGKIKWINKTIPSDKVGDVLITKTAIKTLKPEYIVEKVVNFQFKDAVSAMKTHNEVEISGFGKFYISQSKLRKRIKNSEDIISTLEKLVKDEKALERKHINESKLEQMKEVLTFLKSRQKI